MQQPVYKRILLKLSGEALSGGTGFGLDFDMMHRVSEVIKACVDQGVQVGIVVGGGNFWRGVKDGDGKMERTRADHMGMLATVMNSLALADVLEQCGVSVRVQTALEIRAIAEPYIRLKADKHLKRGRVVIFACGTGNPYFSTDTAAVLRAAEIDAEVILLAKNVDGVYTADPNKDPDAVKYDSITYDDVLAQHLQVMDSTATSLSMDNNIPVVLFALEDPWNILKVVQGEKIGTTVKR
ncbi:MAG: UMP kinase [Oscillospiraceae bacterium]|nr:UMP kinase [Oscillospiraceae bacterium]